MKTMIQLSIAIAALIGLPALVDAEDKLSPEPAPTEPESDGPMYERGGLFGQNLVLGAKLGGGFSQPFGDLGSSFVTELELGYLLSPLNRSFELFLAGQYAAPKAEGKGITDPRLPAPASYTIKQQQAIITLGVVYRLPLAIDFIRPYAALGGRAYLTRTTVNGKTGAESFGENEETATNFGIFGALGAELHIGPGAVLLELQTGYARIDGFVLRDTSAGSLNVALGYRLFL